MNNDQMAIDFTPTMQDLSTKMTAADFCRMSGHDRFRYLYTGRNVTQYEKYRDWREANPGILDQFYQHAHEIFNAGHSNYSQHTIVGVMRYQHDLKKGPNEQFKIDNGFVGFLARDFILTNPQRFGFFQLRELGRK